MTKKEAEDFLAKIKIQKTVSFGPITYIYTPIQLIEDLKATRKNEFFQKEIDKIRTAAVINPILTNTHRRQIIEKLLAGSSQPTKIQDSTNLQSSICLPPQI